MSKYKEDLKIRKEQIKRNIVEQDKLRNSFKLLSSNWWAEHQKLNLLRIDLETINSRIKNLDTPHEGISEATIIL